MKKIKLLHPLISCICITDNRPLMLVKAIIRFDVQNYPNRELVISYPENDQGTRNLIAKIIELSGMSILPIERPIGQSVGKAKNDAIANCNGEYICVWDDDDWSDDDRLSTQYNTIHAQYSYPEASVLSRIILYDATKNKAYHSFNYHWGCSLLCNREILLKHPYTDRDIENDIRLIQYLQNKNLVSYIENRPPTLIHVYHGTNVIDYHQFLYLTKRSESMENSTSDWIHGLLNLQVQLL